MEGLKIFLMGLGWGPPLNKGHDVGGIPEKMFKFASLKNHRLQGFMGENGPFLAPEFL